MSGGSKVPSTTTTTQTNVNTPWAGVAPYLSDLYSSTSGLMGTRMPYFPYETYAARSPLTSASQDAMLGAATNFVPSLVNAGTEGIASMMAAPDVANNPYVNNALGAQANQISTQLQREWLPAIRNGASLAGQTGSTRQGVAEGVAMGDAARQFANQAAQTQLAAYGQGLDTQARAMAMLPQMAQLGMMPAQMIGQVGSAEEAYNQQQISDAMARFNWAIQQEPWLRLGQASNIYSGVPWSSSGTATAQNPSSGGSSKAANALSGAMLGGSIGNMLGSSALGTGISTALNLPAYMSLGPIGAALGLGIGLLGK